MWLRRLLLLMAHHTCHYFDSWFSRRQLVRMGQWRMLGDMWRRHARPDPHMRQPRASVRRRPMRWLIHADGGVHSWPVPWYAAISVSLAVHLPNFRPVLTIHDGSVDGNWSAWVNGACSVTCGDGTLVQTRTCDSPAPQYGGAPCAGSSTQTVACTTDPCGVWARCATVVLFHGIRRYVRFW
jgi:hypothetical protein